MATYEEILEAMESKYLEESGNVPSESSDIGIRLKVLSGELYSLSENISWLENQIYPQTAQGEYLEKHCEERGISRKEAYKAQGEITFSRGTTLSYNVSVPLGTICATDAGVEYVTTESGTLVAGLLEVTVPAEAVEGGKDGNCASVVVTNLVTAIQGVETVSNESSFTGGVDEESDDGLRARLLESYQAMANGTNKQYYKDFAMAYSGITSVGVVSEDVGTIEIYVWGNGEEPSDSLIEEIEEAVQEKRELNATVTVEAADTYNYTFTISVTPEKGCDMTTVTSYVKAAVESYFANLGVGSSVYKSDIGSYILSNCPIADYSISGVLSDYVGSDDTIPILSSVSVGEK